MIKNIAIGGSNKALLLLALLMGLVCAVLVGVYLSGLDSNESGGGAIGASVPVVVAAADIPAQTSITAEMVTVREVPADLVLAGSFAEVAPVLGKKTQVQIVAGQQILPTNAIDANAAQEVFGPDAPISLLIPEGKRAFAIYVSSVASVGGLARAGDHIDLLSTQEVTGSDGDNAAVNACVVLQDVQVLAIGATLLQTGNDASAISGVNPNPDANTMTLAVTPEQVIQLAAIQRSVSDSSVGSQMWVSLRPYGDSSVAAVPACSTATPA